MILSYFFDILVVFVGGLQAISPANRMHIRSIYIATLHSVVEEQKRENFISNMID